MLPLRTVAGLLLLATALICFCSTHHNTAHTYITVADAGTPFRSQVKDLPAMGGAESDPYKAHMLQVLSQQEQKARLALQQQQQPPHSQQHQPSSSSSSSDAETARLLNLARRSCILLPHTELGGETAVIWGSNHRTASAAACCAACHAWNAVADAGGHERGKDTPRCNTWVWCGEQSSCQGQFQECWLKNAQHLPDPQAVLGKFKQQGDNSVPWTSGVVPPDPDSYYLAAVKDQTVLTLHTPLGDVPVTLLPELAPRSVAELRRAVAYLLPQGGYCSGCKIYRSEANFLLQGLIQAPGVYVAVPRHPSPPQKKVLPRGLVCWAGGAGGPDWFVNLIDQSSFGDSHLCWGQVGPAGMQVVDGIVRQPLAPKARTSDMTMLANPVLFNLSLGGA